MTQSVVTYTVVVAVDNSGGRLLPYLTARLEFEVEGRRGVLLVPNAALRWQPAVQHVVPEARARSRHARLRRRAADRASPASGVDVPDERSGLVWVRQGEFVRPVEVKVGLTDGISPRSRRGHRRGHRRSSSAPTGSRRTPTPRRSCRTPGASLRRSDERRIKTLERRPGRRSRSSRGLHHGWKTSTRTTRAGQIEVPVLKGVSLSIARGDGRADGGVGLGQDDADQPARLPRPPDRRAGYGSTAEDVTRLSEAERALAAEPQDRLRLPELQPAAPADGARERDDAVSPTRRTSPRSASAATGPGRCSSGSASATGSTTSRRGSPAASSSGSRSPGR